ncbi:MAG TPA: GNAT family N-acetyltransferase [Ktedonosporobacter sp.]|nr:GNAT family N-acetyltransferase [Ktedonosporobacter sp.]
MSFLLEPDTYSSVRSLFEEMTYHLAVPGVLAGILPGRIYVDDPGFPTAAILIPSNRYRVYLGGEPSLHLLADIIHLLFNPSLAERYWFMVHYTSNAWKPAIEHVLQGLGTSTSLRHFYRLTEPSLPVTSPLPEAIVLARIDQTLVEDASLVNRDLLIDEIHSESPSLEYFFRYNFGFCVQDGRQLVGWCLAEYHYQGRYELGIETIEAYQRQGIATHVASAVIKRAFALGATEIGWHCWASNIPSIATALKLGFQKEFDYPVITCDSRLAPT